MKKLLFLTVVLSLFLVACSEELEPNMSSEVGEFSFTTQDNTKLSSEDLRGKWWVADFIFTNCSTVCLPMTKNMAELQIRMEEENLNAQLVSFSVDPDNDSPKVLKEYAENYDVDLDNWAFLTGYKFETIQELAVQSFKSGLELAPDDSGEVIHGTRFYLVNPKGEIIKNYNGVDSETIEEIIADLQIVLN